MTRKKLLIVAGTLTVVTLLGLFAVCGVALAQTTPQAGSTPAVPFNRMWGGRFGLGFGGGSTATFDAVAKALNLEPTQLFEQLHSGKTLAEIAQAQSVDMQKVRDAVNATRAQSMKDAINQAVKDGKMTQDQADWLLQGIDKGYMAGGKGFGWERGMRGMGRFGGGLNRPKATPTPSGVSS